MVTTIPTKCSYQQSTWQGAALPLRNCTYNLEVTCRDILWPEYMRRGKKGWSLTLPVNTTTIITTNELQLIFTPNQDNVIAIYALWEERVETEQVFSFRFLLLCTEASDGQREENALSYNPACPLDWKSVILKLQMGFVHSLWAVLNMASENDSILMGGVNFSTFRLWVAMEVSAQAYYKICCCCFHYLFNFFLTFMSFS